MVLISLPVLVVSIPTTKKTRPSHRTAIGLSVCSNEKPPSGLRKLQPLRTIVEHVALV